MESFTGMIFAVVVGFVYSWILTFVVVAFLPLIAITTLIHFSLISGTSQLKTEALKDSTDVSLHNYNVLCYLHIPASLVSLFRLQISSYVVVVLYK